MVSALADDTRRRASVGDGVTTAGLVLYALLPIIPGLVVGLAGTGLFLSCLRPLPGDGRFSRPARAIVAGLCVYAGLLRSLYVWPAYLLVPILAATALAFSAGFGRDLLATLDRGRFGRTEWGLIALIAIVAAVALVGWVLLLQPDLSRLAGMLPQWPLLGLIGAGAGFSIVNAILEEVVWRGILQRWLATFMSAPAAVFVQAVSFGAAHYNGFPSGLVGMGLAAIWGAMIGALAVRSRGLAAPIAAHIAADAVIFAVVAGALSQR